MRARHWLFAVCVTSCLAVACGDDDDSSPGGEGGAAEEAGAAGKAGGGGSPAKGGSGGTGGADNPVGEAGEPGAAGMMNAGGVGGAGGEAPSSFVGFVHELVEKHTLETNQPARTDQQFEEPRDDHGHYLAPASAFGDLL